MTLDYDQYIRLAKQEHVPGEEQLRHIHADAIRNPGKTIELPFGKAYLLTVVRVPGNNTCNWSFTVCTGATSTEEWAYDSNDARWISLQLREFFPKYNHHRKEFRDSPLD